MYLCIHVYYILMTCLYRRLLYMLYIYGILYSSVEFSWITFVALWFTCYYWNHGCSHDSQSHTVLHPHTLYFEKEKNIAIYCRKYENMRKYQPQKNSDPLACGMSCLLRILFQRHSMLMVILPQISHYGLDVVNKYYTISKSITDLLSIPLYQVLDYIFYTTFEFKI